MTKQEHVNAATRLLVEATRWMMREPERAKLIIQLAQAHATLALAISEVDGDVTND